MRGSKAITEPWLEDNDDGYDLEGMPLWDGDPRTMDSQCTEIIKRQERCPGLIQWKRDPIGECHGAPMIEVIGTCPICGSVYSMG